MIDSDWDRPEGVAVGVWVTEDVVVGSPVSTGSSTPRMELKRLDDGSTESASDSHLTSMLRVVVVNEEDSGRLGMAPDTN